ncbi:MAG: hypothetical protein GWM87_07235 [Xanthomonadales bacterium]|nr:hypothetical protein [Xanthomonadales bacterium]NIX12748.1 hypothetical protein [Xanthomonadales bacterium]
MRSKQLIIAAVAGLAIGLAGATTTVLAEEVKDEAREETQEEVIVEGDARELSEEEQIKLMAERYNATQDRERDKVVCKKVQQTGTRFKKTVCRTVGAMDRDSEEARRTLLKELPSVGKQEG